MKSQMLKTFLYFFFFSFSNCYYNPIVNSLLNPPETEGNNSALALLGLPGPTLLITGQIIDANGVGEAGLVLQSGKTFAPQTKSIASGNSTFVGGRFYIPYQTGQISFTVYKDSLYYFEFTLDVANASQITYSLYGAAPGIQINGLTTINGTDPPNVFDLVKAYTLDGESNQVLLNSNVNIFITSMNFEFSEPPIPALETGSLVDAWISENISATPSISFDNFMTVTGNTLTIYPNSLTFNTNYEIILKSSILSATGKPLTPRTIKFYYEPPV
ncbi:hypothetical protein [Leptospira jelokensis]|uniref:hypothetical protein n=1 Tax=Leptospira jelokensis TaxID=2484931 RepID=UPI0010917DBB|nr:hypothetical protein [Leptospira jelokensis]TGM05527.1 hypothetical protein EHQ79_05905 [Leptospira jelokensis]